MSDEISLADREGNAVAIHHPVAARRADALARGDEAREGERIRGADREEPAVGGRAPDLTKALDRVRQRVLLSRHARDESSAADFSARFEATVDPREIAPGRRRRFARENP